MYDIILISKNFTIDVNKLIFQLSIVIFPQQEHYSNLHEQLINVSLECLMLHYSNIKVLIH